MSKLRDAVYGAVVGDALGVPVEFLRRGSYRITEMKGYGTHNQPAGTWSDDSSMILATCASINATKCIDCTDMMDRFYSWYHDGVYSVDGKVFDIGGTTSEALHRYGQGITPLECGSINIRANGNGSLMRIIPLAFINVKDEEIYQVSRLTHAHEVSMLACKIYIHIAKQLQTGKTINSILTTLNFGKPFDRLPDLINMEEDQIFSSGYVVHTLEAALWCLVKTKSYEECVLKAVNLGEDTDTTGAVAGGLAGIVYGYKSIPCQWIQILKNKKLIEQCLF